MSFLHYYKLSGRSQGSQWGPFQGGLSRPAAPDMQHKPEVLRLVNYTFLSYIILMGIKQHVPHAVWGKNQDFSFYVYSKIHSRL